VERLCVVIAEDNPGLRRTLVDYLATFGIDSMEATTEKEVWMALEMHPDILVLDMVLHSKWLMLPFLQMMRSDPRTQSIPVIITTAFDSESLSLVEGADYLADCTIFQKPYCLCQLRRAIIELTRSR